MPDQDSLYRCISENVILAQRIADHSVSYSNKCYGEHFVDALRVNLMSDPVFKVELKKTITQAYYNRPQAVIVPYKPSVYSEVPLHNEKQIKWAIRIRDGAFLGMDIYSGYIHNHKTYITTKGKVANIYKRNGKVNSARAAKFAQTSRLVRGIAITGSIITTGWSGYSVYQSLKNNETPEAIDVADFSVGLLGLGSSVLVAAGMLSTPIGWGIGLGVTIYSGGRLIYDIFFSDDE